MEALKFFLSGQSANSQLTNLTMLETRITEYRFLGCSVKLLRNKGAYWVLIECKNPKWELTTSYPQSCPIKALMGAELTIMKRRVMASLHPTFVFNLTKNGEVFHLANSLFEEISGKVKNKNTQDFFNLSEYQQFLDSVKAAHSYAGILHVKDKKALVYMEMISPISIQRRVYGKVIQLF